MILTTMSPMQIIILILVGIIFSIILGVMIYRKFNPKKKQEQQEEEIIIGKGDDQDEIRRHRH